MNIDALAPSNLVATTESIRGCLYQEKDRAPLANLGFDWEKFDRLHEELADLKIGYRRQCYPIEITISEDKESAALPLLSSLRDELRTIRELAPKAYAQPQSILARIVCTVPDGTPHSELSKVSPTDVYVVSLQDMSDWIYDEIDKLPRMKNAWMVSLFGNDLSDDTLVNVDFSKLKELRYLDLAESRLTMVPEGLFVLPKLESLSLSKCRFLEDIQSPERLQALRRLSVRGTGLSDEKLDALRRALPNCMIEV